MVRKKWILNYKQKQKYKNKTWLSLMDFEVKAVKLSKNFFFFFFQKYLTDTDGYDKK